MSLKRKASIIILNIFIESLMIVFMPCCKRTLSFFVKPHLEFAYFKNISSILLEYCGDEWFAYNLG